MTEMILVSKERYEELLKEESILEVLDAMGVDNWCGYDEAMKLLREGDDE